MTSTHARLCSALLAFAAMLLPSCSSRSNTGPNLIDPDAPEEFTTTESGLKYRILRKSDGPKPTERSRVTVDYSGWLANGTVFDSSYDRRQPTSFLLGGVIAGWTEGMQLIGEGGMIELEIPPGIGYGERGSPPDIPPGATIYFRVELHKVE